MAAGHWRASSLDDGDNFVVVRAKVCHYRGPKGSPLQRPWWGTLSAVPLQSPKIPTSTTIKFSISCFFFARVSKYRLLNFLLPAYPLIIHLTFGRDARPWKYVCSDADCRAGGVRRPLNEPPGAENRQELTETGSQICAQTTPRRILFGTHSRCNVHLAERPIRSLWLSADLYILSAFFPEGHLADHEYRRTTR